MIFSIIVLIRRVNFSEIDSLDAFLSVVFSSIVFLTFLDSFSVKAFALFVYRVVNIDIISKFSFSIFLSLLLLLLSFFNFSYFISFLRLVILRFFFNADFFFNINLFLISFFLSLILAISIVILAPL